MNHSADRPFPLSVGHDTIDAITADLSIMTEAVNYHRWIFCKFETTIGCRVLEVGAGIGTYTEMLQTREFVMPLDGNPECFRILVDRFASHRNVRPHIGDVLETGRALDGRGFDTVLCINVLEHIQEDLKAVRKMHSVLSSGGVLNLLVPAYQTLFGETDKLVGHAGGTPGEISSLCSVMGALT